VDDSRERLHGYLSDMLLVERELRSAVRRQCDSSEGLHEAASDLLLHLEAELDARVGALTDILEEVEDGEPVLRSALGVILGGRRVCSTASVSTPRCRACCATTTPR
jgi:hypothetical protein